MDLSLIYSKTSKGSRAVLSKGKSLSSNSMLVLSRINGKTSVEAILADLQLSEQKLSQVLNQLLNEAYIQVVQDFMPSVFDLKSAIEVSEISTEEFLTLGLPEDSQEKTEEQLSAEARAKAYSEEQARKETAAREQEEAERKLLLVTDILAKSGDRIDIEKLASDKSANPAPAYKEALPKQEPKAPFSNKPREEPPKEIQKDNSLDFTSETSTENEAEDKVAEPHRAPEESAQQVAVEEARRVAAEDARNQKAQQKAEEDARLEAERARATFEAAEAARVEEEQQKQIEAEEKARLKAEEKARREEAKARQEEERKARKEAERLQKLAEKKAREEEKARARAEAESKAREEAEQRAIERAKAEARALEEAERRAQERAELQARQEEEARARAEAAAKAREEARIRKDAIAIQKAQAREQARHAAEVKALIKAEESARRRAELEVLGSRWLQKTVSIAKPLLIVLAVALIGLVLLLPFISLALWTQPVERIIANNIGEPVNIEDMQISLWPRPHIVLENVSVGQASDITTRSIHVYPAFSAFFKENKRVNALELDGLTLQNEALSRPLNWVSTFKQRQQLRLENVSLTSVSIKMPNTELPTFNADVQLAANGKLKEAAVSSEGVDIDIKPANGAYEVEITAHQWQPPLGPAITFDELLAKGKADSAGLSLTKIEGLLYGGKLKATSAIGWGNGWKASGMMELTNINLTQATPAINERAHLQGKLFARADYASTADQLENMFGNASVRASFEAENGEIGGMDLSRAASGRQQVGGVTRFEQLTGNWIFEGKRYQLTQLQLKAGTLKAQGEVVIEPDHSVTGKVQTHLDLNSRQLQGQFALSGKMGNVTIKR